MSNDLEKTKGTAPAHADEIEIGKPTKLSENPVERIRELADNRLHWMKVLNDREARLVGIILHNLADVLDGKRVPKVKAAPVVKRVQL